MILKNKTLRLDGQAGPINLWRSDEGVVHIEADSDDDGARGLGFAHAHDRLAQMMLGRLVGQGRLSECLRADAETVEVDISMYRMGMARDAHRDVANLDEAALAICEAYASGVNHFLERHRPAELRLAGYQPEPWRPADSLLMVKLMAFLGLAQGQQDAEKWIIQAIQAGVDFERLRDMFSPHLDNFDPSLLDGVKVEEPLIPNALRWMPGLPKVMASNNWVVAASRSASGAPILCNDPHLEVNRLPAVVSEVVLTGPDGYMMGATIPGIHGVLFGRSQDLALGLTYGFADLIDYYVEDCRDGQFRRGDSWQEFESRSHLILRKGDEPVQITVYENAHGILEGDPTVTGRYLCRAWSGHKDGASPTVNAFTKLWHARTVKEAMPDIARVGISGNWVIADASGNIGYQMSGAVPLRNSEHSGLYPVPGWEERFDWQGLTPPERLSSLYNPADGFIATANDDWNQSGRAPAINLNMASYRADRIRELLAATPKVDVAYMMAMHDDRVSLQARRFMALLAPLLPDNPIGTLLKEWDCIYSGDSIEASWFEKLYAALKLEVFGKGWIGERVWEETEGETGVITDFYGHFDRVLLDADSDSTWFGDEGRDALFRRIAAAALTGAVPPWKESQKITMSHVFFAKLPDFLGFDHGPVVLPGSRATIPQAAIYRSHGRVTCFHPCFRLIADMSEDVAHTNMAGGPSGDRLSPWYKSDIPRWLNGEYKRLRPDPAPPGEPVRTDHASPGAAVALAKELIDLARIKLGMNEPAND